MAEDARLGSSALWVEVRDVAYRTLRARGWSHDQADDGAQDTVIKLQMALERGTVLDNPAGWAATVAHRAAVDRYRRARLADVAGAEPGAGGHGGAEPAGGPGGMDPGGMDPVGSVARFLSEGRPTSRLAIEREQMERLVAALDERDLRMVWMAAEGLRHAEIGEQLGIGAEAVKKAMQRLRRRLRAQADALGLDVAIDDHPRAY